MNKDVIIQCDVTKGIPLPDKSVHCVITSPPYWGLRDYGVPGQLGLEKTPEEYIEKMVAVFRHVWRVLRDDGTLWLNMGDSYAGGGRGGGFPESTDGRDNLRPGVVPLGLKPKDLCMMPARLAIALQKPYYTGKIKSEIDRVWLAAMVDGEGCMFIHKRKKGQSNGQGYFRKNDSFGAGLEVANCHRSIVQRCLDITGVGSICRVERETATKKRNMPLFRWNMRSNQCREIVREIYPYLVGKQHEARLLLGCLSSGKDAEKAHASLIALHNGKEACIDFPVPKPCTEQGWYLRSDIIWKKNNPMPESCTDRPTKSHEHLFLLTKSGNPLFWTNSKTGAGVRTSPRGTQGIEGEDWEWIEHSACNGNGCDNKRCVDGWVKSSFWQGHDYFYDADAIREPSAYPDDDRKGRVGMYNRQPDGKMNYVREGTAQYPTRNKRDVWSIPTEAFPAAHFATFPEKLVEPCIKAGTSEKGCCPECGSPWVRVVEREGSTSKAVGKSAAKREQGLATAFSGYADGSTCPKFTTIGWEPSCKCKSDDLDQHGSPIRFNPIPCTVFDPFMGSGTVGLVSYKLGRHYIGTELNAEYIKMAEKRIGQEKDKYGLLEQ